MEGKLSLLASYDDIMRKSRVLKAGDEAGLKIYISQLQRPMITNLYSYIWTKHHLFLNLWIKEHSLLINYYFIIWYPSRMNAWLKLLNLKTLTLSSGKILIAIVIYCVEFRRFVQNQEQCRIKWHSLEVEVDALQERIRRLEAENSGLNLKLKHARGQIEEELEKRQFLEHERDEQVPTPESD